MAENIIITNPEKLESTKRAILKNGAERLHVLADFDKTLTTAFIDGKSFVSFISVLRDGNYLTPDYAQKAHALYNKYHAIEIDPKVPVEEKKKLMREWWMAHFKLLVKLGLNKKDIEKAVNFGKIKQRDEFHNFIEILRLNNIPLVILSSSGMGDEAISMYLKKEGVSYSNIYIISNVFNWDSDGNATGVKEPIIHSFNKSELALRDFPFYSKVRERKNVLLLGDSIEDAEMINGFEYDNIVRIGFLNENIKENIEQFKKVYDVVILHDGSMEYIHELLAELTKNKE